MNILNTFQLGFLSLQDKFTKICLNSVRAEEKESIN